MKYLPFLIISLVGAACCAQTSISNGALTVISRNDSLFAVERVVKTNPVQTIVTETYVGDSTSFANNIVNAAANQAITQAAAMQVVIGQADFNRNWAQFDTLHRVFGKEPLNRTIERQLGPAIAEGSTVLRDTRNGNTTNTPLFISITNNGSLRVATDTVGTVLNSNLRVFNGTVGWLRLRVNVSTNATPNFQWVDFVLMEVRTDDKNQPRQRVWRAMDPYLTRFRLIQNINR